MRDYHISEYLKNLGFLSKEEIDCDYPVKPFQRPRPQRNDNSSRIDRMEEGLNETRESVNQLTEEFQKLNICKPVARSNFNRSYFTPIKPINPQYAFPDSNNGEDNNWWTGYEPEDTNSASLKHMMSYYQSFHQQCGKYVYLKRLKRSSQKKMSGFHNASEFDGFNLATAEAFGWKVDKPSKFLVKSNFEYISEALGWYKDVAITLRDEKGKPIVTIIGNYACIDNENHGKTYTIPTFSKAPVVKDLPKEDQDQASTNSSSPNSEENLKKSVLNKMNNYLEVRARPDALIFSISLLVLLYKSKTSSEDSVDEIESEAQTVLVLDFLPPVFFTLLSEITSSSEAGLVDLLILVSCILFPVL
ncbi:hypothetical protein RclHR1_09860002 [Rhizophagus clarus]|uniref:Uncharacterized protein n=1 Tax=Rhizophagus clarus TaxID=94130 RepID=A0A2Z6SFM9_9GLOM|nr:hypothetical protein RclHR1_09860002 [Rhizophagus clarus]